jgi:hypothetical protein
MNIKRFNLDVVNKYNMFFMLQKLNATSTIDLYYQEVNNNVPFEDCALFEMANGQVLVAFPEYFTHISKHNLIATNGTTSEVVSLQIFERIYQYYKHGVDSVDAGGFTFMNSAPVPSFDNQWRCDAGLYGVELFADPLGDSTIAVPDAADALLVYEPILSINGVAHLVYIERQNKNNKTELMNNSSTPFATYSLGEALKLILEWAQVSEEPFNNTEPVAVKANNFVQQLGINETLVSNQPDMQIYEYLKGNPTARVRPENVQPLLLATDAFVKKNVAHSCLSSIISLYPDAADLTEVKEAEQTKLAADLIVLDSMRTTLNDPNNKDMTYFLTSRTNLLASKQSILESL